MRLLAGLLLEESTDLKAPTGECRNSNRDKSFKHFITNVLKDEEYYKLLKEGCNIFAEEKCVHLQFVKGHSDIVVIGYDGWIEKIAAWARYAGVWEHMQKKLFKKK